MRSRTPLLCLALVAAGCSLPSPAVVPGPGPEEKKEPEAQEPAAAESLAGTWTRQGESKVAFAVTDDGTTVKGERTSGGDDVYRSYAFELRRSGGSLAGKATLGLVDVPDRTYEVAWKDVKLEGGVIKVKGQEIIFDEKSDDVARLDPIDVTFDFAPAAPAAPEVPAAPAMDMSQFVPVFPSYKHLLGDDAAVGQWADVELQTAAGKSVTRTAIVGEASDGWFLEMDNQMNDKDLVIAVLVDKATGEPKKAWVGKRGKEGKEKAVPPPPAQTSGEAPQEAEEEVTVKAGTFKAKKYTTGGASSWMGIEGDAEGVPLKSASAQANEELSALEKVTVDVGGTSFEAKHLTYDSGREVWVAIGKQPHLKASLRMKASGMEQRLVAQGEDAKPQLEYPR